MSTLVISFRIWFFTALFFGVAWLTGSAIIAPNDGIILTPFAMVAAALASLPVPFIHLFVLPTIADKPLTIREKMRSLHFTNLVCTAAYGLAGGFFYTSIFSGANDYWLNLAGNMAVGTGVLFTCALLAVQCSYKRLVYFFSKSFPETVHHQTINMETSHSSTASYLPNSQEGPNKILVKGLITGGLILAMLIPALFVSNLVLERQARQQEVSKEVSGKWAAAQTLAGPFIYLPYSVNKTDGAGKPVREEKEFWILPDNLQVSGKIDHELRQRSIYKVLLFHANLASSGDFNFRLPDAVDPAAVNWKNARLCYSLSDFKGIEERMTINFNGIELELNPGLPALNDWKGLSAPIPLSVSDTGKALNFHFDNKIKGSERLDFIPLAGNSRFDLQSAWASPSFDGNALPSERSVTDSGFTARWIFNKANLPFSTVMTDFKMETAALAFGVTLVQPADGYAKTNRCIKYAILFIGLTFSIFFIVELMQKKPLHPVQYVLIGLALVIFYTLLLAVSELVVFDYAYAIAATATILLISLYSKSHFQSWRSAAIFGSLLVALYGFIFVLIQLEDTALLIGSIGLFIILAIVMFASRKINWYGRPFAEAS